MSTLQTRVSTLAKRATTWVRKLPLPVLIGAPIVALLILKLGLDPRAAPYTLLRVLLVASSGACGFGLGWLGSPDGAKFRKVAGMIMSGFLVFMLIVDDGVIGWSLATALASLAFSFGFGYWFAHVVRGLIVPPTTFGSAQWADLNFCKANGLVGTSGLRLGVFVAAGKSEPLHYDGQRHALTVAPTRGGKGVSAIIPNLLTY